MQHEVLYLLAELVYPVLALCPPLPIIRLRSLPMAMTDRGANPESKLPGTEGSSVLHSWDVCDASLPGKFPSLLDAGQ